MHVCEPISPSADSVCIAFAPIVQQVHLVLAVGVHRVVDGVDVLAAVAAAAVAATVDSNLLDSFFTNFLPLLCCCQNVNSVRDTEFGPCSIGIQMGSAPIDGTQSFNTFG